MDQRRTLYALAAVFAGFGGGGAGIGRPRLLPGDDVLAVVGESAVGSAEEKTDVVNVKKGLRVGRPLLVDWLGVHIRFFGNGCYWFRLYGGLLGASPSDSP
ncbi:hypothetical protein EMIT0P171_80218 [Pseudomonas sp. IT-P171]